MHKCTQKIAIKQQCNNHTKNCLHAYTYTKSSARKYTQTHTYILVCQNFTTYSLTLERKKQEKDRQRVGIIQGESKIGRIEYRLHHSELQESGAGQLQKDQNLPAEVSRRMKVQAMLLVAMMGRQTCRM